MDSTPPHADRPNAAVCADADAAALVAGQGRRARAAAAMLRRTGPEDRRQALLAMAEAIGADAAAIGDANREDLERAGAAGRPAAMIDRLRLTSERIEAMVAGVRTVADQDDPLGSVVRTIERPNGLRIEQVRVPLGVIGLIYESRPNVTADAAALCLKAGSACLLRGGSEAAASNAAIHAALVRGLVSSGLGGGGGSTDCVCDVVQCVEPTRAAAEALMTLDASVDLLIPRGGEALIRAVVERATVPLLKHAKGVCHVYLDRAADPAMAEAIVLNAKVQRPGVCNAAETLLVHTEVAATLLPPIAASLAAAGVELRADERAIELIRTVARNVRPATEADWPAEYLDLVLAVGVVDDLEAAIEHVERHGSRHSDAIVTEDAAAAERFCREVDSAAVYVNASTRFTDGAAFGMGAEIGISTDKLHARGPCGVLELTTSKYIVRGSGQTR